MNRRPWSAAAEARLRELYPCTRTDELPRRLHRTHSAIKNRVAALHLRKNDDVSMHRRWKRADDRLLRAIYPDLPTAEVAKRFGRTVESIYGRAGKLGLAKSEAYLASPAACRLRRENHPGKAFQFKKGHAPANKGLRRPGYGPGRMKETQFKKGQPPRNWKPVGSERLVDGYRYTKVRDVRYVPWTKNWEATHILLWEKHHRRRLNRRTHALAFKNGDRLDVRLENLELITRGQLMLRNTVHNLPAPLPQTIQLLGALKRKINRRSRNNEEQDRRSA